MLELISNVIIIKFRLTKVGLPQTYPWNICAKKWIVFVRAPRAREVSDFFRPHFCFVTFLCMKAIDIDFGRFEEGRRDACPAKR